MQTAEYHEQVADRIIEAIEAGTAPWMKPWTPGETPRPVNFTTGRAYRGINVLVLSMAGFGDPRWASFKQIKTAGGMVRKGEKGTPILWAGPARRAVRAADGDTLKDADGRTIYADIEEEGRGRFMFKCSHVFNVTQCDGLTLPVLAKPAPAPAAEWAPDARTDAAVNATGAELRHVRGDRAFYRSADDVITMPERDQFDEALKYYHTLLHETVHATAHNSRLDRPVGNTFGSPEYAREELIAEIGAMMAGDLVGCGSRPQHGASYVASWIKALKDDPREITRAASAAQRAATWIADRAPVDEEVAA